MRNYFCVILCNKILYKINLIFFMLLLNILYNLLKKAAFHI